jgi:hypothetical protein
MVRIGDAFDVPASKALILAHRICDVLSPSFIDPKNTKHEKGEQAI